ncbi:hypothetical protein C455_07115 [Haloferax larsenii JCM 13917]|nr:hypothetical protein [Haloferax larsenii]ELZ80116.1 hypothetical protein C455_07115 [Haloferax larsenii JCM 13917]
MPDDHPADEVTAEELVEAIESADADLTFSGDFPNAAELIAPNLDDIFDPVREMQREQAKALLKPMQDFHRQQVQAIAEPLQEISQMLAEMVCGDLPDEAFTSAIAASTVSTRARTRTSPTPPVPRGEKATTTTHDDINVDVPQSLFLNNALAIGSYVSYQFEGLTPKQRQAAAWVEGARNPSDENDQ